MGRIKLHNQIVTKKTLISYWSINQPISYKKIKLAIERAELTGKKKKKEEEIFWTKVKKKMEK